MSYQTFEYDPRPASAEHAEPVQYVVPGIKLHDLTRELMQKDGLSYGVAFQKVQQTYPTLADAYATELRGQR